MVEGGCAASSGALLLILVQLVDSACAFSAAPPRTARLQPPFPAARRAGRCSACFLPTPPLAGVEVGRAHPHRARRRLSAVMSSAAADTPSARALVEAAITADAVATLGRQGYVVIDNAIPAELATSAMVGCEMMNRNGKLQIVREQYAQGRQDKTMVLDAWQDAWGPLPPDFAGMDLACRFLKGTAAAVARHCSADHKWANLCAPPYMQLAMYANTGAKYVRHLDNDPLDPGTREGPEGLRVCDRVVTALLYFNRDWKEEDGGYLRLYDPEPGREEQVLHQVAPEAGRLVLFESDRFFHEVLPAFRSRWALSAWMTSTPVV